MANISSLPGGCYPQPNELLSSWVSRIALNQGLSPLKFWRLITPNESLKKPAPNSLYDGYYDMDQYPLATVLDTLSELTFTSREQVEATTLVEYQSLFTSRKVWGIVPKYQWFFRFGKPPGGGQYQSFSHRPAFCSRCLLKDSRPYWRKTWRFSFSVACLDCKVLLNDVCRRCGSGVDYRQLNNAKKLVKQHHIEHLQVSTCQHCNNDLSTTRSRPASSVVLEQQYTLQTLIQRNYESLNPATQLYFKTLRHLVNSLVKLTLKTHAEKEFIPSLLTKDFRTECFFDYNQNQFTRNFEFWPIDLRARFLYQAMTLIESDPEQYIDLLRKHSPTLSTQQDLLDHPNPAFVRKLLIRQPADWMKGWSAMHS